MALMPNSAQTSGSLTKRSVLGGGFGFEELVMMGVAFFFRTRPFK
jgi:hypothetical protein